MVQNIQYCSYLFLKKYECIKKLLISIAINLYDIIYKILKNCIYTWEKEM